MPHLKERGQVLDVGVGEGRNALFLAKQGFQVTGIDISKKAIEKFLNIAKKEDIRVRGIVGDALTLPFEGTYDVILCNATLHLFPKYKLYDLIFKIKTFTADQGINLITAFTREDFGYTQFPSLSFVDANELKALYKDWEILVCELYLKQEDHGGPHQPHLLALIARKTSFS